MSTILLTALLGSIGVFFILLISWIDKKIFKKVSHKESFITLDPCTQAYHRIEAGTEEQFKVYVDLDSVLSHIPCSCNRRRISID